LILKFKSFQKISPACVVPLSLSNYIWKPCKFGLYCIESNILHCYLFFLLIGNDRNIIKEMLHSVHKACTLELQEVTSS
jgi:hypothetical protein